MRLDSFLATEHPEHSRATWQKYIKAGYVSVNGQITTNFRSVGDDDRAEINLPEVVKQPLDLPIIYEDDDVVVINKPAGVLTHSKGALNGEFTVADFIRSRSAAGAWPEDNNRPGIVHRLDRATSGVIIGAKTPEALSYLQKQFSQRRAKKTYLALVSKPPQDKEFIIDLPIERDSKHKSQFRVSSRGKPAQTRVKLDHVSPAGEALLELKPETGRTHQLRVHLAHIGRPIVGDQVYDGAPARRMMLHAKTLEITLPGGRRRVFTAAPPEEFRTGGFK
jgi:23S rRNA pseudouridine1911/1915/1917 synthase